MIEFFILKTGCYFNDGNGITVNLKAKIKTLLVEDDPKLRLLFKRMLEKNFELQVVEAENGIQGLTTLHREKPVLVFLDVDMPVMNGVEFLEIIRNDRTTRNLLIVMMTATNDPEIVKKILQLGVSDYILKSDRLDELTLRINTILSKYHNLLQERTRKNLSEYEHTINNCIVLFNKPEVLVDKIKSSLETYCELYEGDTGAECLSLFLDHRPAFVILTENTPVLNEVKVRDKIKDLDTENLTQTILFYTDDNYPDKNKFDYTIHLTQDEEEDFMALKRIISSKIPDPNANETEK